MKYIFRQSLFGTMALVAAGFLPASGAAAQTLTTLYNFAPHVNGEYPYAGVTAVGANLYGLTTFGGHDNGGTVYRVNQKNGVKVTTVASLPLGANATATLLNYKGMLYGASGYGGTGFYGELFSVNPITNQRTVLHSFAGADGGVATAPLIQIGGVLYGTTSLGGANQGNIFSYTIATNSFAILHTFGNDAPYYPALPTGGLVRIGNYLYGTTNGGGANYNGTVFKINIDNRVVTTIYSFNAAVDGGFPVAGLTLVNGLLYGVASGAYNQNAYTPGGIFSINPKTGAETTLYKFTGGADGSEPLGQLINVNGTLYGTTQVGGANGLGTVFSYTIATKAQSVAYSFSGDTDGKFPADTLANVSGALYGTTLLGGSGGGGTVFKLALPASR